jgi:hypothetical protein
MKRIVIISILLITFQLSLHAWPNNLIFTLKPNNIELLDKVETDLPTFKEKDGQIYIGKFVHPDIAKRAQRELLDKGFETEILAFFRTRELPMADALTLVENLNSVEENTMLSGTKGSNSGTITIQKMKDVNSAYFTIQIGVYTRSVAENFNEEIREIQVNGKFYYFYGKFDTMDESNMELSNLKGKGYNDAFVTGFSLGQKVSAELLQKMLKT